MVVTSSKLCTVWLVIAERAGERKCAFYTHDPLVKTRVDSLPSPPTPSMDSKLTYYSDFHSMSHSVLGEQQEAYYTLNIDKTRSSKDECSTESNNHIRSTDCFRS